MFKHKDNPKILLIVSSWWMVQGAWTVMTKGQCFLHSASAGDMNPASERNNHCERCDEGNEEMSSWAYVTGADYGYCGGSNATSIELDKIKVFCENEKNQGSKNQLM